MATQKPVKVTILASEWESSKGGLSTITRQLAIQLAKHPKLVDITFFVPQCSEEDKHAALFSYNIKILEATPRPGFEKLVWLSFPPENLEIDVIIGHGVKLGCQAQIIRDSKKCKWIQVVHTDPEELGMFKNYENPISTGEKKHNVEVKLCEMANYVVGVGPKLSEAFRKYLRFCKKDEAVFDLTPGIFDEFVCVEQVPDERKNRSILVFGRGDAEDFELKGFDIAGKAVAALPADAQLMFVGAPDGRHKEIVEQLIRCGVPPNRLRVRRYLENRHDLKRLFCEVDLVLMPSRTEGFGLTALEALSSGLPVLVSKNSGFGEALIKVPFGSSFVVNSEDPEEWAANIQNILDKNRKERLEEATTLRDFYMKKYSWEKQINNLLVKMTDLVLEDSKASADKKTILHTIPAKQCEDEPTAVHGGACGGGGAAAAVVGTGRSGASGTTSSNAKPQIKEGIPSNEELERLSLHIGDKWEPLGRRLKFEEGPLTGFHKDNEKFSEKAYKMLVHWKNRDGRDATYQVLDAALCDELVNQKRLAEKICRKSQN